MVSIAWAGDQFYLFIYLGFTVAVGFVSEQFKIV